MAEANNIGAEYTGLLLQEPSGKSFFAKISIDHNQNFNFERMKNAFSDFQKALECPVCLDVVKKPFKQCASGHLVCVSCLGILTACPTCEGEFLLENPVCIQHLLEHLLRSCRYSGDGCKEMVQDGDDHERFCGFRRIKCRTNCDQNVLAKELSDHVNAVHPDVFIVKTEKTQTISWRGYNTKKRYVGLYVCLFNRIFCISLDNSDDEQLKITFESFSIGKLDGDYYAKITFTKGNICYSYTLKAFPAEETEHDSNLSGDKTQNKEENFCMKIPKSMLSNFIDKDGALVHEVFIFKG